MKWRRTHVASGISDGTIPNPADEPSGYADTMCGTAFVIGPGGIRSMPETQSDPNALPGVDLSRPSPARVYDFILGGSANWAVDREFGRQLLDRLPLVQYMAMANRMFLNRAVRHLSGLGVRQFLDIGAGVPTAG